MDEVKYLKNPYYLAATAFTLGIVIVGLGSVMGNFLSLPDNGVFVWGIFSAMILIYAIFNTVSLIALESPVRIWTQSIYAFLGLAAFCIMASWLISGISLNESSGFRSIISVLGICYSVFLGIGWSIKQITVLTVQRDLDKLKKDSDEIGHDVQ